MKMLITVFSSLLVGLSLASTNFSPIHDLHNFLVNRRRIFGSLAVAGVGFVFLMSGLLIGLVEGALQFDAQGFLMWSSLFGVAAGLGGVGLFSVLMARITFPAPVVVHQSFLADLNKQFNLTEILENLVKSAGENRAAEPMSEKFSESHSNPAPDNHVQSNHVPSETLHH
jgi:hypothetical protein